MKTVKVSELSGAALDWVVATLEGFEEWDELDRGFEAFKGEPGWFTLRMYSTSWEQGGPIIEREDVVILRDCDDYGTDAEGFTTDERFKVWRAIREPSGQQPTQFAEYERDVTYYDACEGYTGPTPLIAAMRCYVASKLGDTVEVPEELC